MSSGALQFLASEKGQLKLLVDGHLFFKEKKQGAKTAKTYWKCEMYQRYKCHVRVITAGDAIDSLKGDHNHMADAARVEALQMQDAIRKRAKNSEETPQQIISNVCAGISTAVAEYIPEIRSIKRTIRNIRARAKQASALPRQTEEEFELEEKYNKDDQEESADIEITEEETQIIDFVKTEDTETQNPLADDEDLTILDDVEEQSYAEDYQGPSSKRPKKEEIEPSYGGQESSSSHRSDRDENDIFGEYVSGKMRTFDHKTKCIVQYLMGNILFQADMGKFKGDTVNCDEIMTSLLKLFSKNGNNSKSAGCERSSNSRL